MLQVSENFKRAMTSPVKEIQAYLEDIKSEDDLISFKISCDTGMCKTAMRKLEASYLGEHNLLGKEVHVGFGVRLDDGTFEYLDYGSFLVSEMTTTKDTGVTNIVGYDKMVLSMTPYTPLDVEYPIDLLTYTKKLCEACNLELGGDCFGTNLYDQDLFVHLSIYNEVLGDGYTGLRCTLTPNTTYTIKVNNNGYTGDYSWIYAIYDSNKELIGRLQEGAKSEDITITFTTDDTGVIYFTHLYATQERLVNWLSVVTIQLEQGSSVHGYSPFNQMNYWEVNQELWANIDGITYRDIFVQIAQATATTCIIGNDDKVYFKALTDTGEELTYDNMRKLKLEPKYGEINSVVIGRDPIVGEDVFRRDEESITANGLTEYRITNNEIIDKDREGAIESIYNTLRGVSYYPFETTTEGLGWYEIGDIFNIINDTGDVFNTALFNFSITVDGSIKETLKTSAETKTQSQYQYATAIDRRVKNTEIRVNKQDQYIEQLVTDVYDENGVVNENFTKVYQDITNIVNSVQKSGGSNLIKNSVMFAYDNDNVPSNWNISDTDGTFIMTSNSESLNAGCLSGHSFTLENKIASQRVSVSMDNIYSFSTRIKKKITGSCYVKLYNDSEEHVISLTSGEESFYNEYTLQGLQPKDNYYIVEFYGSEDSEATFTDNMLAVGDYSTNWTQANGEIMNTQVNVNIDGVLVKSTVYLGDYTVMSPLEFAGYSNINGTITKVFTLNKDTTYMTKAEVKDQFKMSPIKIVPIRTGERQGWAFVPVVEEASN